MRRVHLLGVLAPGKTVSWVGLAVAHATPIRFPSGAISIDVTARGKSLTLDSFAPVSRFQMHTCPSSPPVHKRPSDANTMPSVAPR